MGQAFMDHDSLRPADPAAMAALVTAFAPSSNAEALKLLRESFPESPLSARVAALDFLMRGRPSRFYRPR